MNRLCKCGGRILRTDIVKVSGTPYYQDTDKLKANFKCNSCGEAYTQRKRQPKLAVVDGSPDVEKFRQRILMHLKDNEKGTIAFYVLVDAIAEDCERWRKSLCYLGDMAEKASR